MGTRADFYVGQGQDAEWIGSVAFDGYEWAEDENDPLTSAKTEADYRIAVANVLNGRSDATLPAMGWPWPWNTSGTTDYAYYFKDGKVNWDDRHGWPDMSARKNVARGERSGLVIITPNGIE